LIEASNLSKSFGRVRAVAGVDFAVSSGEVFGLLGPNGAGKTTALRILATLLRADTGSAKVAGHDVSTEPEAVRRSIGVVNGGMGLYDRLTGREVLHYFGGLYGMTRDAVEERVEKLDRVLSLGEALARQTGGFSTGMRQKLVIARAILHDPPVIFFDEATSGLDVIARRSVLDLVRRFAAEGKAVVYSTHVMAEAEELCDRLAVIYRGKQIALDTVEGLLKANGADSLERAFFEVVGRRPSGSAPA
jgi:sodium transport system ATP-binding protein